MGKSMKNHIKVGIKVFFGYKRASEYYKSHYNGKK